MKVKLAAVIVALSVMAFAGSAFAQGISQLDNLGSNDNTGDVAIFNYYDIRTMAQGGPGLSDNYFSVVNTDGDDWYQAHVRVRTGQCSVELLDFDLLLSPLDVFTFDLYQGENGATVFASCDTHTLTASQFDVDANGCFILDTTTFPSMLSLIAECGQCPDGSSITAESALEATRWGYVEVIGEAELQAAEINNSSATACLTEELEAGVYNAFTFDEDCRTDINCSGCVVQSPSRNLVGKQYYAVLDGSQNLLRLAQQNAYHGDEMGRVIHRPCYSDNSPGCSSGDGELESPTNFGYAYSAATNTGPVPGADDLNYCFWADTITSTGDVINQNGAGATFGPTFADFVVRSATASATTSGLVITNNELAQRIAVSHYFYIPGQGESRFVFTFPIQHFLNQSISVTKDIRTDTEQATCVLPAQKFISPGLPAPGVARGEVTIIEADEGEACAFNEGWIAFELEVTDDGPNGCNVGNCYQGSDTADNGEPAVFGTVVNWGNAGVDVMGVSPVNFKEYFSW